MAISNSLTGYMSLDKPKQQPNIFTHLITRMGLGVFASVLPLFFFRFIVSFFTSPISSTWQLDWASRLSASFILAMLLSISIATVIACVSYKQSLLKQYGRLMGRICTIAATGLAMSLPYFTFMLAKGDFLLPSLLLACFAPVMTFIVVRSATKDYLLRVRIWFDLNA